MANSQHESRKASKCDACSHDRAQRPSCWNQRAGVSDVEFDIGRANGENKSEGKEAWKAGNSTRKMRNRGVKARK